MGKSRISDSTPGKVEETARLLKAVADLDRLKIVHSLREGPKNVSELARILRAEIVNVSHHLSVLRRVRLVTTVKKGRFVYYSLNPEVYTSANGVGGESLALGICRLEMLG
jgi:DNA-binding transcriptional ArsR family regulator